LWVVLKVDSMAVQKVALLADLLGWNWVEMMAGKKAVLMAE
jgi:hypothetical protein